MRGVYVGNVAKQHCNMLHATFVGIVLQISLELLVKYLMPSEKCTGVANTFFPVSNAVEEILKRLLQFRWHCSKRHFPFRNKSSSIFSLCPYTPAVTSGWDNGIRWKRFPQILSLKGGTIFFLFFADNAYYLSN